MSSKSKYMNVEDKIIVITGANTGIGFETALELARRGGKVILACRNRTRAKEACEKIKAETNNQNIFVEDLDLADLQSVKCFARSFLSKWEKLDILINNAGVFTNQRETTKDGFEKDFGVNYLGHFLLTNLLLDLLVQSAPSKIINVSSAAYKYTKMNWNDLQHEKNFSSFGSYAQSKLANILFTIELSKRLNNTNVAVVAVHPGLVKTGIYRGPRTGFTAHLMGILISIAGTSPKNGAKSLINCALCENIQNYSGKYFNVCKSEGYVKRLTSESDAERLWEISEKMFSYYLNDTSNTLNLNIHFDCN